MDERMSAELAGLPGVGKTTLLGLARPRLERAGITVRPPSWTGRHTATSGWRPDWLHEAARLCELTSEPERMRHLCARAGWRANLPGVHPEGMVHMAWRLAMESGLDVRKLVESMPIADVVVHIVTDIGTAAWRVAGKSGRLGPTNLILSYGGKADWHASARKYQRIVQHVARRSTIIQVDNYNDPERGAHKLAAVLMAAARRAPTSLSATLSGSSTLSGQRPVRLLGVSG